MAAEETSTTGVSAARDAPRASPVIRMVVTSVSCFAGGWTLPFEHRREYIGADSEPTGVIRKAAPTRE
ncbi:hypothetical protein [Actinomadura keratinilytica]|uniref:hypothetical protein n=1 Tax=Actinomadura keratinilytica TaxID=547461 RepID=UPI0031EAF4F9